MKKEAITELTGTVAELSREFGTSGYVQGGGGNSSCKSADTLWVKPSGTTLSGMTPQTFVRMSRTKLDALFGLAVPTDAAAREALVKDVMAAAVLPGQKARASVEAPLHNVLGGTYVVHTHPALVNGMTCAAGGAEACARLFPDALWVPYIDPGYTLCIDVRKRVIEYAARRGRQPNLLVLENHGIFVTADTAEGVRILYRTVMDALRGQYRRAGIEMCLPECPVAPAEQVESTCRELRAILGAAAAGIAYGGRFDVAPGPISPDHIVYAKSHPCSGPLSREGVAAFHKQHGYLPLVFALDAGVFTTGEKQSRADLVLEMARDGALVMRLAAAFGGIQYMTERAKKFIENWEVESYRQKQMG